VLPLLPDSTEEELCVRDPYSSGELVKQQNKDPNHKNKCTHREHITQIIQTKSYVNTGK
jgi:hypothetical protein